MHPCKNCMKEFFSMIMMLSKLVLNSIILETVRRLFFVIHHYRNHIEDILQASNLERCQGNPERQKTRTFILRLPSSTECIATYSALSRG